MSYSLREWHWLELERWRLLSSWSRRILIREWRYIRSDSRLSECRVLGRRLEGLNPKSVSFIKKDIRIKGVAESIWRGGCYLVTTIANWIVAGILSTARKYVKSGGCRDKVFQSLNAEHHFIQLQYIPRIKNAELELSIAIKRQASVESTIYFWYTQDAEASTIRTTLAWLLATYSAR